MDESEYYESIDKYEEYEPRFYDNYRYKNGRFAPKGRGTRRGYDEPMYQMTPGMYREHDSEWYRDMDKKNGKMYYSEPSGNNMSNSRYENAKRGYEESKAMHKDNSVESKQTKMKDLENYLKELSEDVTRLVSDASQEEKALLKSKMQLLLQKLN